MRTLVLLCTALTLAAGALPAAYWDLEPIYNSGFGSGDVSLASTSTGVPAVSYTASGVLYLAQRGIGEWISSPVAQVGFAGGWSSMAFGPADVPCVAYIDALSMPGNLLKCAVRPPGAAWNVETVADVGWLADFVSVAVDPAGAFCIAYCASDDTSASVAYARRLGNDSWAVETVAAVGSVTGPALAIAGESSFVSWADGGVLKVASKTASGQWQVQPVDGSVGSPVAWYTSITTQANGEPAAAYFRSNGSAMELRFARRIANAWSCETAAVLSAGGMYSCSVAVSSGGTPFIGYFDPGPETFRHAWKTGGVWRTETVDSLPGSGGRQSLRIDPLGRLAAAHFDVRSANVRFAWTICPVSISEARSADDGTVIQLSGVVASTSASDLASTLFVQEPDGSSGLRLDFTGAAPTVTRGMVLDVQGETSTVNGERRILDPVISPAGAKAPAGSSQ